MKRFIESISFSVNASELEKRKAIRELELKNKRFYVAKLKELSKLKK